MINLISDEIELEYSNDLSFSDFSSGENLNREPDELHRIASTMPSPLRTPPSVHLTPPRYNASAPDAVPLIYHADSPSSFSSSLSIFNENRSDNRRESDNRNRSINNQNNANELDDDQSDLEADKIQQNKDIIRTIPEESTLIEIIKTKRGRPCFIFKLQWNNGDISREGQAEIHLFLILTGIYGHPYTQFCLTRRFELKIITMKN